VKRLNEIGVWNDTLHDFEPVLWLQGRFFQKQLINLRQSHNTSQSAQSTASLVSPTFLSILYPSEISTASFMNRPDFIGYRYQSDFLQAIPPQNHRSNRSKRHLVSTVLKKLVLGIGLIPLTLTARPALAAERIYFSYGPFERSISFQSLETYAREGKIEGDLAAYTQYATPEQIAQLREILSVRAKVSSLAVSQFLYTDQGETILKQLGDLIQTEAHVSGFYALRAALILAADDEEEGITPLNVLRKFPTSGLRIEVDRTLAVVGRLEQLINDTNAATTAVTAEAAAEAAAAPVNLAYLQDLRQPGSNTFQKTTITLKDDQRNRVFEADVYLPMAPRSAPALSNVPLIVISHGLGSDRTAYSYLAQQLASYGFAVALPEHPGSNADQLQALLGGRANQVSEPSEFIDRPLDVKFLLDELDRLSRSDPQFRNRINLQQVGVIGQSYGGYTAMALAGARINPDQLRQDCPPDQTFNLSFLLQCRALDLQPPLPNLRDDRVKAILAINPINSSVLGQESISRITIPAMIVGGNADTVAPVLPEQIRPFTWLGSVDRYLMLIRGSTHFSTIGPTANGSVVTIPAEVIGPDPAVARRYMNAVSVAFFKTHLNNQLTYRQYLSAAYANTISQSILPLELVRSFTGQQLADSLENPPASPSSSQNTAAGQLINGINKAKRSP
jgi:predicted dienelactone hydrolase